MDEITTSSPAFAKPTVVGSGGLSFDEFKTFISTVVDFKTKMIKGIFVKVPDGLKNFVIKQYSVAGTWVMETDSKELNHWKIQIPKGKYNILGFSHKLKEYEVEKVLGLSMNEYFKLLTEKDITVNYSKFTGQWLVLV